MLFFKFSCKTAPYCVTYRHMIWRIILMYPDLNLFINGKWRKTKNDLPVINPATEEEMHWCAEIPVDMQTLLDDLLLYSGEG